MTSMIVITDRQACQAAMFGALLVLGPLAVKLVIA